jgi:hypothetical protein
VLLRLEGERSDIVVLKDNDPAGFHQLFLCADGAKASAVRQGG